MAQRTAPAAADELQAFRKLLGQRIRQLRNEREWSQERFAEQAGIHRVYVGSIERGVKGCGFETLGQIAQSFGISITELLGISPVKADTKSSRHVASLVIHNTGRTAATQVRVAIATLDRAIQELELRKETLERTRVELLKLHSKLPR